MRYLRPGFFSSSFWIGHRRRRAQTDAAAIRASKRLQPLRITEPIVIDGRLTEPAWALAEVGRDFYQQDPDEGALSFRTERDPLSLR